MGEIMTSIAEIIKEKMHEQGLSAHALEKRAGLKNSAVQNILYGRSKNPSIKILTAISQVLNCNISQLIGDESIGNLDEDNQMRGSQSSKLTVNEDRPWHADLYISSFNLVSSLFRKNNTSFTKNKLLTIIDEVYLYSYKQNLNEPDKNFAEWLVSKNT